MFKKSVQQQLLSYHYSGNTKQIKNNKLNLFGKAIAIVDTLPIQQQLLSSIQEVDLSHNAIYEIDNFQQFHNAEFINLSHNRIIDGEEVLKLQKLTKLHTLYLKGNPFLRSKFKAKLLSFLLSLNTDVQLISGEMSTSIQTYSLRTIQNQYFRHYLGKIQIHIQLANNYQLDESFLNPSYAIFPKIKKMFEQFVKESTLKRTIINTIPENYFEDQQVLLGFLKGKIEQAEKQRSQIIKRIYEREELLRNIRVTYRQRVVPKKIAVRNMSTAWGVGVNHYSPPRGNIFSPPKLKESVKQSKIVFCKITRKQQKQNSPIRLSSQLIGQNEQIFLSALIKLNPLYHLLHSPLTSLKSHEKQLLIQNLCLHLREKFKQVYKYEKKEQEYLRAREENSNLEEHLREVSLQMKGEQEKTNNKLKKLSIICQEESQRVQSLCQELNQCKLQLIEIKNQNIELKSQNEKYKKYIAKIEQEERIEQKLRQKTSNSLKRRIMRQLTHKAYHFSQLTMLQQINRKVEEKQLKENTFNSLQIGVKLSKGQFALRVTMMSKHFRSLVQNIGLRKNHYQLGRKIQERLNSLKKHYTLLMLKANYEKQRYSRQTIQKLQRKISKKIKKTIFSLLKQQLQDKNEEQQWLELQQHSKILTMRLYLRVWKKYINQMENKTSICARQQQLQRKAQSLSIFISKSRKQLNYQSGIIATDSFLVKIRRFHGYLKFSKTVSTTISSRKLKGRKIQLIRQHQYLYWFISTIRDWQIKKRILVQRELHEVRRRDEQQKTKLKNNKSSKLSAFASFVRQAKTKVIMIILNRQQKWMKLSDQRQGIIMKDFISNLRTNWVYHFKLSAKSQLIKSVIIRKKILLFLSKLKTRKQDIDKFKRTIKRDKLVKCFFRWKCYNLWKKMQGYKQKFLQLQPEITNITHMQREAEKEKELLLLQMEEKELMVRDYQKKCEEYQYILHSKDMKYDKLRQIYSESMQQQQLNATVKLEEEKYLGELKGRYSFKTKMGDEDNYLKSFAENYKAEMGRDTVQRINAMKSRDSFISSFKRF